MPSPRPRGRSSLLLACLGLAGFLLNLQGADPAPAKAGTGPFTSMFWLWRDEEIENPAKLIAELEDLKKAGFDGLYVMPRATRYQLADPEMHAAVKLASEECAKRGIEFIWGADPRLAAARILSEQGGGAEVLLSTAEPGKHPRSSTDSAQLTNEAAVKDGRYSCASRIQRVVTRTFWPTRA